MSRSFFNALSGVSAYQRSLEQIADNLANVNTTAHKRSEASFTELLYGELLHKRYAVDPLDGALPPVSGKGTHMYPVTRFLDQGPLLLSERALDLGIEGRGYFRIITAEGDEVYTRRGSFFVDSEGTVVTEQGDFLDVDFDLAGIAADRVVIGPDGSVSGINAEGELVELGQIMLYTFVNEGGLFALGGGLFEETEASGEAEEGEPGAEGFGILRQYSLEGSNVNLALEMVHLIASQRALQANVRSLVTADELKALTLLVKG